MASVAVLVRVPYSAGQELTQGVFAGQWAADVPQELLNVPPLRFRDHLHSRLVVLLDTDRAPDHGDNGAAMRHEAEVVCVCRVSEALASDKARSQFSKPRPWKMGNVNPKTAWNFFCISYTKVPFSFAICS